MKKNLIAILIFLLYGFIAWGTDTAVFNARQALLDANYFSLSNIAWGMYFIFSWATIAYIWIGLRKNETAIFSNILIALVSSIAILSTSYFVIDMRTFFPFRFFFHQIGRIGISSALFLTFHFSLALSGLNLIRGYRNKSPILSNKD